MCIARNMLLAPAAATMLIALRFAGAPAQAEDMKHDMARVLLEYGKDPEMRKLAEAVIAAQEKENWLTAHPAK